MMSSLIVSFRQHRQKSGESFLRHSVRTSLRWPHGIESQRSLCRSRTSLFFLTSQQTQPRQLAAHYDFDPDA